MSTIIIIGNFLKLKDGACCYYKLNNNPNDFSFVKLGIITKNIENMDENEFINISQRLINCIEIQESNAININKNINFLYSTNMKKITLSEKIYLNLDTNVEIDNYFNSGYNNGENVFNEVIAYSNNNLFVIMERSNETIENMQNSKYGKSLNWNRLNYKGIKFYVSSKETEFVDIFFEIDGILYSISCQNSGIDYKEMTKYLLKNMIICND